ncbi:hypothetical protein CEXT_376351 [Caerostris extrusa]|uniref:Uncharacterized protein n=1 Tax=Caerostris extrusa TaxID=172846 RepID=A0AAV4NKJ4_CAEEX|nr:hypothetical protein CEXT_376351 [Caerostris extrusa]
MQIDRDYHRPDWTLDELHPRNFLDGVPMGPLHVLPWMSWGDRLQIAQYILKDSIRLAELDSSNHWIGCDPSVRLRVVNSGYEVRGVELGEQLYLRVEMLDECEKTESKRHPVLDKLVPISPPTESISTFEPWLT